MKTESNGGPAAESNLTRKLARLYEDELDRAERDYPTDSKLGLHIIETRIPLHRGR